MVVAKVVNGLIKDNINSKPGQKRFVNNVRWCKENQNNPSPWDIIWFMLEPTHKTFYEDVSDEDFKDSLKYFCDMLLKNDSWKKLFDIKEELEEEHKELKKYHYICDPSGVEGDIEAENEFDADKKVETILAEKGIYVPDELVTITDDSKKDESFKEVAKNPGNFDNSYVPEHKDETLTEAPDDDGILNDDELDAEEQKERDEMEARFKARRDKVAQQRADRDAKLAKEQELKAKADEIVAQIGDDWSFDKLFDLLVPESGKCDSLAGEIIRAVNKLDYRWYNDGDRFFEDYGIETCGQPAFFLANFEHNDETPLWDVIMLCAEYNKDNDEYDEWINKLKDIVCDYINVHPELLSMETEDMNDVNMNDVEAWLDENNLMPKYDCDSSLPRELESHLDRGNISERDLIWEIESWLDNIGGSRYSDISIDWGNVYVNDCNKAVYDELDGGRTLYDWLERYAQELTDEYGDPDAEEDEPEEGEGNEEE